MNHGKGSCESPNHAFVGLPPTLEEEDDSRPRHQHSHNMSGVTPIDPSLFREVQIRQQRLQALVSRTEEGQRRHSMLKSVSTTW